MKPKVGLVLFEGVHIYVVPKTDYDALAARLRGLIVAICEAQEEGGDVALAIDEAGRAVARPANSAGDAT